MRILFVDDHQLVREALAYYLKASDEKIEVVEAGSLDEALRRSPRPDFDIVLLDYRLPGVTGDAAVAAACHHFPETPVIVLSGAVTRDEARSALSRGAAGVISKEIEGRQLMATIRGIIDGESDIFGLYGPDPAQSPMPDALLRRHTLVAMRLSNREAQVAQLLVDGLSNKEIATALGIADITVRLHLRRVFSKLGARSRTDAVRIILTSRSTPGAAIP
ncbi:MAG TPA: response regulator transcription factor [Stellaceae bacterium]|nr:response regulator transcription factor [Stellaceae bacterium]